LELGFLVLHLDNQLDGIQVDAFPRIRLERAVQGLLDLLAEMATDVLSEAD
jgi:hypothetical protein